MWTFITNTICQSVSQSGILVGLASTIMLGSKSHGIHNHILLSYESQSSATLLSLLWEPQILYVYQMAQWLEIGFPRKLLWLNHGTIPKPAWRVWWIYGNLSQDKLVPVKNQTCHLPNTCVRCNYKSNQNSQWSLHMHIYQDFKKGDLPISFIQFSVYGKWVAVKRTGSQSWVGTQTYS
jgi:hypothetical protein